MCFSALLIWAKKNKGFIIRDVPSLRLLTEDCDFQRLDFRGKGCLMSKSVVAIVVAIIGALGVLGAALISSSNNSSSPTAINQSSTGPNSPNIAGVQGDVVINPPQPRLEIPKFESYANDDSDVDSLIDFIDSNRGKLVQLNVSIPDKFSLIGDESLYIALESCVDEGNSREFCVVYILVVFEEDYNLYWDRGDNYLEGYFTIGENISGHQGTIYTLTSVSRELIAIETQR